MSSVPGEFVRAVAADKRMLAGSAVVLTIVVVSSFAPLLSPYDPIEVFSGLRNSPHRERPGTSSAPIRPGATYSAGSSGEARSR